jgi:hypothetical protein
VAVAVKSAVKKVIVVAVVAIADPLIVAVAEEAAVITLGKKRQGAM